MPLRIGILGAGQMGRTHAAVLARDPRVRIVGVADADAERSLALASRVEARPLSDLEALLGIGLDLLVVTTPNRHHADASLAALQRGVAVFCEKPMAVGLEEARRVCAAAEKPGAFYAVAHNRRHAPVYRHVRRLIEGGFVPLLASMRMHEGDYRTPAWVANRSMSGGFLYENLVHFFDLMEWLVGPIGALSCLARSPFYEDLNDFVISVEFSQGALGAITATGHGTWTPPAEGTELIGDHASIVVEGLDRVRHARGDGVTIEDCSSLDREERWGYRGQDGEVIEALLAGTKTCFPPRRALRTLEVAEACALAAREARPVRLAPPPVD
ncbi:MAG TPA: Gfo/Idh/MocA family oxidoreductase [Candidatus Polarisedimenticolia bacterium]|nr:Gfo/Idh/MocA family oxidoreductase [Candidatus Polarisedimenticolia bacterium]